MFTIFTITTQRVSTVCPPQIYRVLVHVRSRMSVIALCDLHDAKQYLVKSADNWEPDVGPGYNSLTWNHSSEITRVKHA